MNDAPAIPSGASHTFCPPHLRRHVLVAAILASSLGFIDSTVVPIAIPAIRADIGASLTQTQWISSAYLLMVASLVMAGGALGDRYGLRNIFGAGIVLFLAASLLCAAAPDPAFLIGSRALQGFSAAIMVPGSLAIIARAYPPDERGKAIGIWAAASAATTGLGPIGGGLIIGMTGDWGWRLIFAINLPLGLAALALLFKAPADRPEGGRRLDPAGVGLATLTLGVMALGLSGGREALTAQIAGAAPADWSMTSAGLAIFLVFLWWESRARQPMMPLTLFADHAFAGANLATFLIYFALSAVMFFLPMTLITAWETSAAQAALTFVPITLLVGVMSGPTGKASGRIGPRIFMAAGSLVCALAYAWLALSMDRQQFWGALMPAMTLMGVGMGLLVSPLSAAVMTAVPDSQTGIASAINNTVARLSGLFAIASLGGVISHVFASHAGGDPLIGFGQMPHAEATAEAVAQWRSASNAAFAAIAWIAAAMCAVATVVSRISLDGMKGTEQR
jgi:EmrB/QacA subfamily drug resistance transporter